MFIVAFKWDVNNGNFHLESVLRLMSERERERKRIACVGEMKCDSGGIFNLVPYVSCKIAAISDEYVRN